MTISNIPYMSNSRLREVIQEAYDHTEPGEAPDYTAYEAAAYAELQRRKKADEAEFFERVNALGGKDAFDYEVRDPKDGLGGNAFDLICDQFFGLDDTCDGDYYTAWNRAMDCLASMERVPTQHKGAFIAQETDGRFYVYSDENMNDETCVYVCDTLNRAIEWVDVQ